MCGDAAMSTSPLVASHKLQTPTLQQGASSSSGSQGSSSAASAAPSDLSGAPTGMRGALGAAHPGDLESPAAPRKQALSDQRGCQLQPPSAPQKEGSKVHKRHSAPPLVGAALVGSDDEMPDEMPDPRRALDMSEADPHNVNQLSLSPMNMASPTCVSAKHGRTSAAAEAQEERRKRQRRAPAPPLAAAAASSSLDAAMRSPSDSPPLRAAPRFAATPGSRATPGSPLVPSPSSRQRMMPPSPRGALGRGIGIRPDAAPPALTKMNSIRDTKAFSPRPL